MPAYIIATSACRLCIDYIQQQFVCVFVPFILATSPSDQGETCHFAVYLEDYVYCCVTPSCVTPVGSTSLTEEYTEQVYSPLNTLQSDTSRLDRKGMLPK